MLKSINFKAIGGVMLIVGTTIGGGMLALPVANSKAGFALSSAYLCFVWAVSTFAAFLTLEVNLSLPDGSNMVSMAKQTLGRFGEAIAWLAYTFLLFCLLSAYISGGADMLQYIVKHAGITLSDSAAAIIFVITLGAVVTRGIHSVDHTNRVLMFGKLGIYLLFVFLVIPSVQMPLLLEVNSEWALGSWMVLVTSFGFSILVPSLRSYFNDNIKLLRRVMLVGSVIPLICYILWDFVIMGTIPQHGPGGLVSVLASHHQTTELATALSSQLNNYIVLDVFRTFSAICMLTAFLGVSMSLTDFLADGLNLDKKGGEAILLYSLTFLPSLLIVLLFPGIFIQSLSYGGLFCVILLILMPILMAWRGRYVLKTISGYRVWGGKPLLLAMLLIAVGLTVVGVLIK